MKVNVGINNLADITVDKKFVKKVAISVIKGEIVNSSDGRNIELSIVFVGMVKIREINYKFRKKDYATDVLSFSEDTNFGSNAGNHPKILGELVICAEVVKNDALESGKKEKEELAWVVIHGMLHLFGYDHEKGKIQADAMRKKEEFYLLNFK